MINETEPKYVPSVGEIVVLRGLRVSAQQANSALIGPRIGEVGTILPGGRLVVHLAMGGLGYRVRRYSKRGRVVELVNVERLATKREITLGQPCLVVDAAPIIHTVVARAS